MNQRSMFRDPESSSGDDFDQLRSNLPQYSQASQGNVHYQEADDFSQWQLSRFNRSGHINYCKTLSMALRVTLRNLKILTFIYLPHLIITYLSIRFSLTGLFIPLNAIYGIFATSLSFSILAGEHPLSRIHFLLSWNGLFSIFIESLRNFILIYAFIGILSRVSTTSIRIILLLIFRFVTFFHSCFLFEGRALSCHSTLAFSLRISLKAIPLSKSIFIYLCTSALITLGPVTFGISVWVAYFTRSLVFLAICGSGSSTVVANAL